MPRPLCETEKRGFEGGTWNRDGVILFSDGNIIRHVSATGGTATPVTARERERIEIGHYFPTFLPDGKSFLYNIRSPDLDVRGLYVATLGFSASASLLERNPMRKRLDRLGPPRAQVATSQRVCRLQTL